GPRTPNAGRHRAARGPRPPIERDRASDDRSVAAKTPPQPIRNHRTGVVGEPLSEERRRAKMQSQRWRERHDSDVSRLARRRQVGLAEPEPAEDVEARRPALVLPKIGGRAARELFRLAEARTV